MLDSGDGAVLVLDEALQPVQRIDHFRDAQGQPLEIDKAQGLTVSGGKLYIADTERQRVIRAGMDGVADLILYKPDTPVLDEKTACNYTKVLVDERGRIYAIANDVNMGALVFDSSGRFLTLYGSTTVEATAEVVLKYIRRRFMSEEQRKNDYQYTPITLTNFDADGDGFIYTVARSSSYSDLLGKVRSLNALGEDIYKASTKFGDVEWDRRPSGNGTQFIDVDVADDGSLVLLDSTRSRVFVYSETRELIAAFGCEGEQRGSFVQPTAVETAGDRIYVLDARANAIQMFTPNAYVQAIKTAAAQMAAGDYTQALESFRTVQRYNTNSQLAYVGMGTCYDYMGDYAQALTAFRNGHANDEYSVSYREYRREWMKEHFVWVLLGALALLAGVIALALYLKRQLRPVEGSAYCPLETKRRLPLYMLFHPISGAEEIRPRGFASPGAACLIGVGWLAAVILQYFFTGFSFNENRPVDFSIFYTVLQTLGVLLVFVLANFGLSSFLTGKGKFGEVLTVTAYALIPYIVSVLVNTLLSNALTQSESMFMTVIRLVGVLWSAFILFFGLMAIHQYSVGKTVLSFVVTAFGMLVIVFLGVLLITLYAQVLSFVGSIVREVSIR